jgi:D,D-heptose 1,7-bisphosphate phosphatase
MTHKAVFLDRDDTLISDPGYISHPNQVKLLPGVGQSLALLQKMGYLLVVVTNQSGIARGILTEERLEEIHHHLKKLLADDGVYIDAIYHCPYHPEGTVENFAMDSDLRKPAPGMLLKAAKEMDIDLLQSWMIGDSYRDVAAGNRAGCRTILLDTPGKTQAREPNDPEPDKRAVNLREAVNILRMFEFQQKAQAARSTRGQDDADAINETRAGRVNTESSEVKETTQLSAAAVTGSSAPAAPKAEPTPKPAINAETPKAAPPSAPVKSPVPTPPPVAVGATSKPVTPTHTSADEATHQLLEEILHRVKSKNRYDQYAEFSVFMLLAWLVQALAAFGLVLSVWFWLDQNHGIESVQTMIGYAIALELLVIALLIMHEKNK